MHCVIKLDWHTNVVVCVWAHLGGMLRGSLNQCLHNASIDVEEIVTGHARLSRDTSWDDNQVSIFHCSCQVLLAIASHLQRMCTVMLWRSLVVFNALMLNCDGFW